MNKQSFILIVLAGGIFLGLGCASVPKRTPLPEAYLEKAEIPGIPNARIWGDELSEDLAVRIRNLTPAAMEEKFSGVTNTEHAYLAISGGGANGAFGAGLLLGWRETGNRPEFTIVTGISTGGLIAPLVFVGGDLEKRLEMYKNLTTEDMMEVRRKLKILTGDAVADAKGLQTRIAEVYDADVMQAIAAEYKRGRRLFVGTTNLDAERPVIWDIGAIANSGHPSALQLIQKILLASASAPAVFPPVSFTVEADGKTFDELHVDGGMTTQVFAYPSVVNWKRVLNKLNVKGTPRVYIIRNSRIHVDYEPLEPKLFPIIGRLVNSLVRTQGLGDMNLIFLESKRDGLDFNLAFIPESFKEKPKEPFDKEWMTKLFNVGFDLGKTGYPWEKFPPGLERVAQDRKKRK